MRCHTRNRSEAPLLEGDFTDEEEEEQKESTGVGKHVIPFFLYLSGEDGI